ncbi:TrkH family potassium uptake protein [Reinekea thalattae]|uniref:Trk system potassium uptake protein n=1 Tax=Reinekea thalattae TaxID=2593301 RepID=A0A5C8Z2T0_9GAMM|nr:TrkH family potassium uptake protein [Reinekea thalattae]TXR51541.1 potassium transporter [Reinekea thalattae]
MVGFSTNRTPFNLLSIVSLSVLPLAIIGTVFIVFGYLSLFVFADHLKNTFVVPGIQLLAVAFTLWLVSHKKPIIIKGRTAPFFAVLAWLIIGFCAAIPIAEVTHVSAVDAIFESFSALTTTGATVLTGLDSMPHSFLLYRQFLQWLGGLGIVIFVVAVLPTLNVGGMKLLKAEVPGPMKDDKLVSRTVHTAQYLWIVYSAITILCAIAYYLAGMSFFDAISHSFSTVSTGGFSTHDASLGYFESELIYLISDFFMIAGAVNFALHYHFFRVKRVSPYLKNEETRAFFGILLFLGLAIFAVILTASHDPSMLRTLNHAFFILISFMTSTGFGGENFTAWPLAALFLLLVSGFFGGCAGSTAGGSKIIRIVILFKLVRREVRRLIHPGGVFSIRYQGRPIEDSVIRNTLAFILFVIVSNVVLSIALMMTGLDLWSSVSAVASCLNVVGPAFGQLSNNFIPVSDAGTALLTFTMLLGRLEYLTILVLLIPKFWQY